MNQEKKTKKSDLLFLVLITILAVAVRLAVRTFVAEDWSVYWSDWLARLSEGGFRALADDFYDYAPPVMYILYFITLLPVNAMTAFKGLCCLLDFVGAALIGRMVTECSGSRKRGYLAYGVFLFLPTVILNAAVWSQCDIIYTLLILTSVYYLMNNRTWMMRPCVRTMCVPHVPKVFLNHWLLCAMSGIKIPASNR